MIQPGDRIGVGVSAGRTACCFCARWRCTATCAHHDFTMTALMLTMGREKPDTSAIEALCRELDVPIVIRHTEIYEILFEWRKDPNPCALVRQDAPRHAVRHVHGQGPQQAGAGPSPGGCAGDAHDERDLRGAAAYLPSMLLHEPQQSDGDPPADLRAGKTCHSYAARAEPARAQKSLPGQRPHQARGR